MQRFLEFPNEVIEHVVSHVYHDDLANLAVMNSFVRAICRYKLRINRKLHEEFGVISNLGGRVPPKSLARMLLSICESPVHSLYPFAISICGWYSVWTDASYSEAMLNSNNEWSAKILSFLRSSALDYDFVPASMRDSWLRAVDAGNEWPVLAMLFFHVPNLASIFITEAADWTFIKPALDYIRERPDLGHLVNLRSVEIDSDAPQSYAILHNTAWIPSVRRILGHHIDAYEGAISITNPANGNCNLDMAIFWECQIPSMTLQSFIESMQGLKWFSYILSEYDNEGYQQFYSIRSGLAVSATDSLEYLQLFRQLFRCDLATTSDDSNTDEPIEQSR